MIRSLWIAKTGLDAQQTNVDVISHNLANVSTTGYKRQRPIFEDLIYQYIRQPGGYSTQETKLPTGLQLGTGVRTVGTNRIHLQGNLIGTENPLDVAIDGRGFFQVQLPDGTTAYSRDGNFHKDDQGQLVTSSGYLVLPGIIVPEDASTITIGTDGTVSVNTGNQAQPQQIGQIQLATFINPAGLQAFGENLFLETGASGAPNVDTPGNNGFGTLKQLYLESSNVNVAEELVNMIQAQRAYELNSKAITVSDQMLQRLTQL